MVIHIDNVEEIGRWIRSVRKAQGLRQDDLAAMIGASHVFLGDVERGKGTVQLGKVFEVLRELGIEVMLDVPQETADLTSAGSALSP